MFDVRIEECKVHPGSLDLYIMDHNFDNPYTCRGKTTMLSFCDTWAFKARLCEWMNNHRIEPSLVCSGHGIPHVCFSVLSRGHEEINNAGISFASKILSPPSSRHLENIRVQTNVLSRGRRARRQTCHRSVLPPKTSHRASCRDA